MTKIFKTSSPTSFFLALKCPIFISPMFALYPDSPPHLLWVPTETLGRALKSCQSVLEGGPQPDMNQSYFQSALRTTVGILDSILYLTSRRACTQKQLALFSQVWKPSVSFLKQAAAGVRTAFSGGCALCCLSPG